MKKNKSFTHEFGWTGSIEWYTPKEVFKALNLKFDLDPCSPGKDIVPWIPARKHFTIEDNGLHMFWGPCKSVWLNPPYGRATYKWLETMTRNVRSFACTGIALLFSRTDTNWFQDFVAKADAVCFLSKRLSFIPSTKAYEYSRGLWHPKCDLYTDVDGKKKKSQTGCGSILVAWGKNEVEALYKSKLGLTMVKRNKS